MCGIFGIVAENGSLGPPRRIQQYATSLFKLSESRGKEASGMAILSDGKVRVCKHPIAASTFVRTKEYRDIFAGLGTATRNGHPNGTPSPKLPFALIGHSRLVTNGLREFHYNNQPVIASGIVAIHNGIVVNDEHLWHEISGFERNYDVDTEVITALVRYFLSRGDPLISAVRHSFERIQGATSVALLFEDLGAIILATNNGSLYFAQDLDSDALIFASEEYILQRFLTDNKISHGALTHIQPGEGYVLACEPELKLTKFALYPKISSSELEAGSAYKLPKPLDIVDISITNGNANGHALRSSQANGALPSPSKGVRPEFERRFELAWQAIEKLPRCTRCVLPVTMPFSDFDENGVCYYCRSYQPLKLQGAQALRERCAGISKKAGRPDCVVSISGGRDSTYALHYVVNELGLHPVTYTYDWGMVTDLARRNIARICGKLGIEHILVSADIVTKRANIRKNVSAWLRRPDLGLIPLFMAGDKQFFYHGSRLMKQFGVDLMFLSENPFERTNFKTGFCGISPEHRKAIYALSLQNKARLAWYYFSRYLQNPRYFNSSLIDTFLAYCSYYVIPHNFVSLFEYIPWEEASITSTLVNEYDWELASDTKSSWRIGDGTASFYNYIYLFAAGFTENDTFRSHQIRAGQIDRETALSKVMSENRPRWESIRWYCETIGIDFDSALESIHKMQPHY